MTPYIKNLGLFDLDKFCLSDGKMENFVYPINFIFLQIKDKDKRFFGALTATVL